MKRILQTVLIMLAFLPAISFAQDKKVVWPEMKRFHSFMSASYHPVEEGNYAPLKANADSLFAAARAWQGSTIPESFKKEETLAALKQLTIKCGILQKAVISGQSDDSLKKLITEAHEVFHKIVGECRKADE